MTAVTFAKLPKDDRWEAGWWCAAEPYGQRKIDESQEFHLLPVPYGMIGLSDDGHTPDLYTVLSEKHFAWCKVMLSGWWSARMVGSRCWIAFTDPVDLCLFREAWL